jgi:hypothetical protein
MYDLTIKVSRTHVIKHLYDLHKTKKNNFNFIFYIKFLKMSGDGDEAGIDAGGLTR